MLGSPGQEVEQGDQVGHGDGDVGRGGVRRGHRNDRNDNRRYHTAGAIDDIKVGWLWDILVYFILKPIVDLDITPSHTRAL